MSARRGYLLLAHDPCDDGWLEGLPPGVRVAHSVPELLAGGWGPWLVEVESEETAGKVRRFRVLRSARLDLWTLAAVAMTGFFAARDFGLAGEKLRALGVEASEVGVAAAAQWPRGAVGRARGAAKQAEQVKQGGKFVRERMLADLVARAKWRDARTG